MFHVVIEFAGKTQLKHSFNMQAVAKLMAQDLLKMFSGEEMWLDERRKTYYVTVPLKEIVECT